MPNLSKAYWVAPNQGLVLLERNWPDTSTMPPLGITSAKRQIVNIQHAPDHMHAELCGFYVDEGCIVFQLFPDYYPQFDLDAVPIYVAGDFNQWANTEDKETWRLKRESLPDGRKVYAVSLPKERVLNGGAHSEFKFVTNDWSWLYPNYHAPNLTHHKNGICNYRINPNKTGDHCFVFEIEGPRAMDGDYELRWDEGKTKESIPINAGLFFYKLTSDYRVGSMIEGGKTIFRLFAPRARKVTLEFFRRRDESDLVSQELALMDDEVTWETVVPEPLDGAYYYFKVGGRDIGPATHFRETFRILDPWARATAGHDGPGIVVADSRFDTRPKAFKTPRWNDLVVCECHVRDLTQRAPIEMSDAERLGFTGLKRWVATQGSYLQALGVNAIELQPIQQYDAPTQAEYHWGYMTTNYFSPCCHYGLDPDRASQIEEFRDLVDTCHEHGLAVILDVVYNHVGEPNFLLHIDKQYYFDITPDGELLNWSGCGNTLRADAAMAKRLIIESLTHLIENYGVDGFRFDLGELIGLSVLKEIEAALRRVKRDVILVAEPWSFRGHIARDLRHTGWAFWNDGYREFLKEYVLGHGNHEGVKYFMSGCLSWLTSWPSQSVNYVESHDDRTFLDKITENADFNGFHPTELDRKRCHLMFGVLMCSLGIPMFSAGQDFMRSKHGKNNTYLDGEENALDYNRIEQHRHAHEYFKNWIRFRLSEYGCVFRLRDLPGDGYTRYWGTKDRSGVAALWNASGVMGEFQVLFACNPNQEKSLRINVDGLDTAGWKQIADAEHFNWDGMNQHALKGHEPAIELPPMGVLLMVKKND